MEQIKIGDYVIFKYENAKLTGLVSSVIDRDPKKIMYEIVPSAIGIDKKIVVERSNVKKAYACFDQQ